MKTRRIWTSLMVSGLVFGAWVGIGNADPINSFTLNYDLANTQLNGSNVAGYVPLTNVSRITYQATSFIGINQMGAPHSGIAAGDTFDDYIAGTVTSYFGPPQSGGPQIVPDPNIGFGNRVYQLTFVAKVSGVQTPDATHYALTHLSQFDFFFDTNSSGTGLLSGSDTLQAGASLSTFADGLLVESGTALVPARPGSNLGTNNDAFNSSGSVDIAMAMVNRLISGSFESDFRDTSGNLIVLGITQVVAGIADANNNREVNDTIAQATTIGNNFGGQFGFASGTVGTGGGGLADGIFTGGTYNVGILTTSNGSLVKDVVNVAIPEPITASLGLMGLAGLGMLAVRRRRA